ncbi:MAG: hypothetical protein Q7R77_03925 [Candidatus Daviesbacteria bacterium]|nr:hypothetical protein [Candidatus Daviesbacteria bacterium]
MNLERKEIVLWWAAIALSASALAALAVRDYKSYEGLGKLGSESNTAQTNQPATASEQSDDGTPSIFKDRQAIEDYLVKYLQEDRGSLFKRDRELSIVITPKLVQMKVVDPMGIMARDFPDKRSERSREIPTNGPGTGPSIKALYWGQEIPGLFAIFVSEKDPQTHQLLNIWAAPFSNEGGWPFHKQPHPEFFRVGGLELDGWKWYTGFDTEDGPISGEEYFGVPPPKLKVASVSPISAAA